MTLVLTSKDFERRRNHFAHQDYENLISLYYRALKEGLTMKAYHISKIIYDKFGEGDFRSGYDYGNEVNK
jgi:hypothetical protein